MVILDSGSDVSVLPMRCLADEGSDSQHSLRDCHGGSLNVSTSLISLGQLYQLGWRIEEDNNGQLCLKDPSKNVETPVHYHGKSFA